jgi:hypothetical protein
MSSGSDPHLNELLVELPPEAGRLAQLDRAVDKREAIRDELPPDRVAGRVEALD